MSDKKVTDEYALRFIESCKEEADQSKLSRMSLNEDNFEMYQLRHNFEHKTEGQSKEILSKTRNSTEQIKSFFQQSLADLDEWWKVSPMKNGSGEGMVIRPEEMYKLTNYMLKEADYFSHIGKLVQLGLLGSLSIAKVHGELVPKPIYKVKKGKKNVKSVEMTENHTWRLKFSEIRQEDYYPDPTGDGLYEIEEFEVDLYHLYDQAEGEDAIYDISKVEQVSTMGNTDLQKEKTARETGQDVTNEGIRSRVRLTEFWGSIIDETTGKMLRRNCLCTIANETTVIRSVEDNPNWHQTSPIVAGALIEVASSVWGIALMDAGTKHNRSLIEIYNLMIDSAMKAIWGVNQVRVDAMEDQSQLTGGIKWGTNIKTNSSLPIGGKVIEPVITGEVPSDVINMFNLMTQETLTSMMTNDLRMGAQSSRAVKATEVVASENAITSVFQGMAKNFEGKVVGPELELAWKTIAQNWDLIDPEVFKSLFGSERGLELSSMDPQDVFVNTVNGTKFEVFGISMVLKRQADYRKWTTLLQTIGASEVLIEAFLAKYSFEKFLGEVMTALDINKTKIENEVVASSQNTPPQPTQEAPSQGPNNMSQVPGAQNAPAGGGGMEEALASAFASNQMNMPSSQAIK